MDPAARAALVERVGRLRPDAPARWGRFTAPEMVSHVSCTLRQGLGELPPGPATGPLAHAPLNWVVIHVLPWPKGKVKSSREFLDTLPGSWHDDLAQLRDLIERFGSRDPAGAWPASTPFGHISGRSWGVLQYRHLKHHLEQFGV